jgi:hypothetical protein
MSIPAGDPNSLISQLRELDSLVEGYHNTPHTNSRITTLVELLITNLATPVHESVELERLMLNVFRHIDAKTSSEYSISSVFSSHIGCLSTLRDSMSAPLVLMALNHMDAEAIRYLTSQGRIPEDLRGDAVI